MCVCVSFPFSELQGILLSFSEGSLRQHNLVSLLDQRSPGLNITSELWLIGVKALILFILSKSMFSFCIFIFIFAIFSRLFSLDKFLNLSPVNNFSHFSKVSID